MLDEGPRQASVATVFTAWGILVEGFVALAFLAPLRGRWTLMRPAALSAFADTTYAFVVSFALLLAWGAIFPQLL